MSFKLIVRPVSKALKPSFAKHSLEKQVLPAVLRHKSSRAVSRPSASQGTSLASPRSQAGAPLSRLFDDFLSNDPFFRPFFQPTFGGAAFDQINMGLDISETPDHFVIKAELPGVDKKEVKLTYSDGVLHITAERKEEDLKEGEKVHYSDFNYGKISRSLRLPDTADKDSIDAQMQNGVLIIKMKKAEHAKEQEISIK